MHSCIDFLHLSFKTVNELKNHNGKKLIKEKLFLDLYILIQGINIKCVKESENFNALKCQYQVILEGDS